MTTQLFAAGNVIREAKELRIVVDERFPKSIAWLVAEIPSLCEGPDQRFELELHGGRAILVL